MHAALIKTGLAEQIATQAARLVSLWHTFEYLAHFAASKVLTLNDVSFRTRCAFLMCG